jgi:hypothetical protein
MTSAPARFSYPRHVPKRGKAPRKEPQAFVGLKQSPMTPGHSAETWRAKDAASPSAGVPPHCRSANVRCGGRITFVENGRRRAAELAKPSPADPPRGESVRFTQRAQRITSGTFGNFDSPKGATPDDTRPVSGPRARSKARASREAGNGGARGEGPSVLGPPVRSGGVERDGKIGFPQRDVQNVLSAA